MRLLTLLSLLLTATITYAQDNITLRNGEEIPAKVLEVSQTDLKYRRTANPDGPVYTAPLRDVLFIKYANGTKDSFGAVRTPLLAQPTAPVMTTPGTTAGLDGLQYQSRLFSRYYTTANGQRIGLSEAGSLFSTQPDAMRAFDRGRSLRTWSVVTAVPAVLMIGAGIGMAASEDGMGSRGRMGGMRSDPTGTTPNNDDNDRDGHGNGAMMGAAMAGGGVLLGVASVWLCHRSTMQFRRAANRYNDRATTSLHLAPSQRGLGLGAVVTF